MLFQAPPPSVLQGEAFFSWSSAPFLPPKPLAHVPSRSLRTLRSLGLIQAELTLLAPMALEPLHSREEGPLCAWDDSWSSGRLATCPEKFWTVFLLDYIFLLRKPPLFGWGKEPFGDFTPVQGPRSPFLDFSHDSYKTLEQRF